MIDNKAKNKAIEIIFIISILILVVQLGSLYLVSNAHIIAGKHWVKSLVAASYAMFILLIFLSPLLFYRRISPYVLITVQFTFLTIILIVNGYTPIHDAILWSGVFHYYYDALGSGVLPLWNPYSQTGTPFYINYQSFGLLMPFNFIIALMQKIFSWDSVSSYVIQYMFIFYIFILGAYALMENITNDKRKKLLFVMLLSLACFPTVMRSGLLNLFFLIPFIAYYVTKFIKTQEVYRYRLYGYVIIFLVGMQINNFVPVGLVFFFIIFIPFVFIFKIAPLSIFARFVKDKFSVLWTMSMLGILAFLTMPVVALFYDFKQTAEVIPAVRTAIQFTHYNIYKNIAMIAKIFASDINENLFSTSFSANTKVSLTLGNIVGLILEPFQRSHAWSKTIESSEVSIFMGIIPIIFLILVPYVLLKEKEKEKKLYIVLFVIIAAVTFILMNNFDAKVVHAISLNQKIATTIFPFMQMVDMFQNFGVLFILCSMIVAGYACSRINVSMYPIIAATGIIVVSVKYCIGLSVFPNFILNIILAVVVSGLLIGIIFLIEKKIKIDCWLALIVLVAIIDLLIPTYLRIVKYDNILMKEYRSFLMEENVLTKKPESEFINYRKTCSFPRVTDPRRWSNGTFFGYEIYAREKICFPHSFQAFNPNFISDDIVANKNINDLEKSKLVHSLSMNDFSFFYFRPRVEYFYMTKYYYDYIANISYDRHIALSSLNTPIVRFIPLENVLIFSDKYAVVDALNNASFNELYKNIYIEKHKNISKNNVMTRDIFKKENIYRPTASQILRFTRLLAAEKAPPSREITITGFNFNEMQADVDTTKEGYIYFCDGYSAHWRSYLDGKPLAIEKTNINFKAVRVPAGRHHISFTYFPRLFVGAVVLYVLGCVIIFYIMAYNFIRFYYRWRTS